MLKLFPMEEKVLILVCHACGAPIKTNRVVNITACEYCGFTYQVPKLIEANAICPICRQNDSVEKASGVLRFTLDNFQVPHFVNLSEESGANKKRWGNYLLLFSIPLLIGRIFINEISAICFGGSLIAFLVALYLFYLARKEKLHAQNINAYHRREMNKVVTANHKEFNRLKPVYDILYYCHRDKIIFFPNERYYALPDKLRQFLSKHAEK
jgi:hypothetical protein